MPETRTITKNSTMQEVLDAYPSAQRALFQQFHIGGCHSCGYEPDEILEEVVGRHNITNLDEVLSFIHQADEIERRIHVSPEQVGADLKNENPPRLVDVRTPEEYEVAHIQGAEIITEELAEQIMGWSKDTPIVFVCHSGQRSLDAASYFSGHGFKNARSMTGGLDAWSLSVDSSLPRYELAREAIDGKVVIRPLRLSVSEAEGCMRSELEA